MPAQIPSPYLAFTRGEWARLRDNHPMRLTADEVAKMRGLGDRVDVREVEEVYLPLSRLLTFYVQAISGLHEVTGAFLGEGGVKMPFVIGVAGSVAVGKSTTSRILQELLLHWPDPPRVSLVTTDGFLYPNAELQRRGLLQRKGFPESYDRRSLLRFIASVKSGMEVVRAPVYSHLTYDIVPGETIEVRRPDVLIVEGLNVLQPPALSTDGAHTGAISDYFDFSVYVDAEPGLIKEWYIQRFLRLRQVAFADPQSYFHRYATLTDSQARETADGIWSRINEPNLVRNVAPTQDRATLILTKSADHSVSRILLRKL